MPYLKVSERDGKDEYPSHHPLFEIWRGIIRRCTCDRAREWPRYGGRGIIVCERWKTFANFIADIPKRPSPLHSIDRIDNDGNYEPGNVRWATRGEQQRNMRTNVLLTFQGKTQTVIEWSRELSIPFFLIHQRKRRGLSIEMILHKGVIAKEHRRKLPPKNTARKEAILNALSILQESGEHTTIDDIAMKCGIGRKLTSYAMADLRKQNKIDVIIGSFINRRQQWKLR